MKRVFDCSVSGPASTSTLFWICWSISDYAIKFLPLAAMAGFVVVDELSTSDLPASLDGIIHLAIRVELRLTDRWA